MRLSHRFVCPFSKMEELFSGLVPDAPTPLSSAGTPTQPYSNAAGEFDLTSKYGSRKAKSRRDSDQPKQGSSPTPPSSNEEDDAAQRYFGSFSIQAHRNVMDLLKNHPMFDQRGSVRMNRVKNNTKEKDIMPNDPTKTVITGGDIAYNNLPQASQTKY